MKKRGMLISGLAALLAVSTLSAPLRGDDFQMRFHLKGLRAYVTPEEPPEEPPEPPGEPIGPGCGAGQAYYVAAAAAGAGDCSSADNACAWRSSAHNARPNGAATVLTGDVTNNSTYQMKTNETLCSDGGPFTITSTVTSFLDVVRVAPGVTITDVNVESLTSSSGSSGIEGWSGYTSGLANVTLYNVGVNVASNNTAIGLQDITGAVSIRKITVNGSNQAVWVRTSGDSEVLLEDVTVRNAQVASNNASIYVFQNNSGAADWTLRDLDVEANGGGSLSKSIVKTQFASGNSAKTVDLSGLNIKNTGSYSYLYVGNLGGGSDSHVQFRNGSMSHNDSGVQLEDRCVNIGTTSSLTPTNRSVVFSSVAMRNCSRTFELNDVYPHTTYRFSNVDVVNQGQGVIWSQFGGDTNETRIIIDSMTQTPHSNGTYWNYEAWQGAYNKNGHPLCLSLLNNSPASPSSCFSCNSAGAPYLKVHAPDYGGSYPSYTQQAGASCQDDSPPTNNPAWPQYQWVYLINWANCSAAASWQATGCTVNCGGGTEIFSCVAGSGTEKAEALCVRFDSEEDLTANVGTTLGGYDSSGASYGNIVQCGTVNSAKIARSCTATSCAGSPPAAGACNSSACQVRKRLYREVHQSFVNCATNCAGDTDYLVSPCSDGSGKLVTAGCPRSWLPDRDGINPYPFPAPYNGYAMTNYSQTLTPGISEAGSACSRADRLYVDESGVEHDNGHPNNPRDYPCGADLADDANWTVTFPQGAKQKIDTTDANCGASSPKRNYWERPYECHQNP